MILNEPGRQKCAIIIWHFDNYGYSFSWAQAGHKLGASWAHPGQRTEIRAPGNAPRKIRKRVKRQGFRGFAPNKLRFVDTNSVSC